MKTEMIKISYLSDNQLKMVVRSSDGERIDLSTTWLKVHLQSGGKSFTAVHDPQDKETKYCHVEDDALIIDIPSMKLGIGIIEYMIEIRENSSYFEDGYKNTFSLEYIITNIEVV